MRLISCGSKRISRTGINIRVPEDLPVPPPVIVKPVRQETVTLYSEKEIIRLLLKFGSVEFERTINKEDGREEMVTIADYIVREIISDDLLFDDQVCAKIFADFRFHVEHGLIYR